MPNPHIPVNPRISLSIQWSGCVELPSVHPRHAARTIRGGDQRTFMVEQPILRRCHHLAQNFAQKIAACPDHVRPIPLAFQNSRASMRNRWSVHCHRPAAEVYHLTRMAAANFLHPLLLISLRRRRLSDAAGWGRPCRVPAETADTLSRRALTYCSPHPCSNG